ncbi:MAG: TetR/AcrR family transcriptional regulator [Fusobacterium sp.]|nr:TetR/AcrR family transcriptional regulator [Fusobacterium sp.]
MEKENKRNLILETVKDTILTEGYSKISINKITSKCNISKGSFYTYFTSKEEMLSAIIDEYKELIVKILEDSTKYSKSLDEFLDRFIRYRHSLNPNDLKSELTLINLRKNLEIIDEKNFQKLISINSLFCNTVKENLKKYTDFNEKEIENYSIILFGVRKIFVITDTIKFEENSVEIRNVDELKSLLESEETQKNVEFIVECMKKILK